MKDRAQRLITLAQELGFAAVGIARIGPAESFEIFEQWLQSGRAAEMDYLRLRRIPRQDPRELLPEARSIICVAARYPGNPSPGAGFAMHARGADYHDVIRDKLREMAQSLRRERPSMKYRICVDSAPILEREWAVRAGIGWIGRQGQIVNPQHGACLLLGELLVDIDLTPSERVPSQCGECRRCVQACPAAAIGDDGRVDARRCISYLTVEHKDAVPTELRGLIGKALFGCDACTTVCPKNPKGDEGILPELRARDMPTAREILNMAEEAFLKQFAGTAVLRTGLERLKRNARLTLHRQNA